MSVITTVLFDRPQSEIASLILDRLGRSFATSIVTGFLTPKGLSLLDEPIVANPHAISRLVIGAATYPALEGLDSLVGSGVGLDRLRVHLGHGAANGLRLKFRPMLHSKVYLMELAEDRTCAFIGSRNVTHFALAGLNGEAAVMLEGPSAAMEFVAIRNQIAEAWSQAVPYDPLQKQAYAWWSKQYFEGLRNEIDLPSDYDASRTIVVISARSQGVRPKVDDVIYFEIPAGIVQLESLRTEAHIFLFDTLPANPHQALSQRRVAHPLLCQVLGIDTQRGNLEIAADWQIAQQRAPNLVPVAGGVLRPHPTAGMQQVRARVSDGSLIAYEYLFERPSSGWAPELSPDRIVSPADLEGRIARSRARNELPSGTGSDRRRRESPEETRDWALVRGLRSEMAGERDQAALALAAPDSGSFILVSVSRRRAG